MPEIWVTLELFPEGERMTKAKSSRAICRSVDRKTIYCVYYVPMTSTLESM